MCSGWVPGKKPEGGIYGYATDDIFYLETCLYSQVSAIGLGLRRDATTYPLTLSPDPTPYPNRQPQPRKKPGVREWARAVQARSGREFQMPLQAGTVQRATGATADAPRTAGSRREEVRKRHIFWNMRTMKTRTLRCFIYITCCIHLHIERGVCPNLHDCENQRQPHVSQEQDGKSQESQETTAPGAHPSGAGEGDASADMDAAGDTRTEV